MKPQYLLQPVIIAFVSLTAMAGEVKVRPLDWAQPVINTESLSNLYHVSDDLYRSEQPDDEDLADLQKLGIRTIISLRHYHTDSKKFAAAGIGTVQFKLDAGSVTIQDLVAALKAVRSSPKPVLVHCWHGSDRTGFIVAGYRIIEQNWPIDKAIEELVSGGFGYHAATYENIVKLLRGMNAAEVRREVQDAAKPKMDAPVAEP